MGGRLMLAPLFIGKKVRLGQLTPQEWSKHFSAWSRNSEYGRLLQTNPVLPVSEKQAQRWFEEDPTPHPTEEAFFAILRRSDDKPLGFAGFWGIQHNHGSCFTSIGLGEKESWGQGYGSEALQLGLDFVFSEWGLHRVSLIVFAFNQRAIRAYENLGFRPEGTLRQMILREGRRHNVLSMGILRDEFYARRGAER
jgi:RimJ/RimL family protein N-acetyltransferase